MPRILELLLEGKTQEGIQALSYYVARMKEGRAKGGRVESKAKSEAAKKRWEKRWSAASAVLQEEAERVPIDLYADNPPEGYWEARNRREALEALAQEAQERGEYRVPLSIPGVKLGSDLEARG